MTKPLTKLTLSVAASAVLVSSAFALDPAVTNFGYVNGANLTIFDASDPNKTKTIIGTNGQSVGISPTGAWFYSTNNNGTLTKYNAYSVSTINSFSVNNPLSIAITKDGLNAYVTNAAGGNISIINTLTDEVSLASDIRSYSRGVGINSNGLIYVINQGHANEGVVPELSSISIVNELTNTIVNTVVLGGTGGAGITFNKDGTKAYITSMHENKIYILSTTTNTIIGTVENINSSMGIVLSPDGTKLYVSSGDGISIIDTPTNSVINTIASNYGGISISPDGSKIYATSYNSDTLYVINTTTNEVSAYNSFSTRYSWNLSPFISPNLITGTLDTSSSADMTTKGFTNYVNFAGGTLRATGSFTLSNPIYLHDAFNLTYDDSSTFTTVAGGTVDTNGNAVTLSGEISGTGGLTKSGTGVLTLSGTNTYSGATTINAGTLAVTGDTSSSSFTVNSGATLSGNGTVGTTTVSSGGIIAPSTTSTLSVAGNLIMESGSTLKVNAYANGTNSKVSATGTATINGGSVNVIADNAGTWNNSTLYTVVSATGGVTGTFASVTDNLAFLDPTLSYESGAVKLTLARNDVSYVDVVVPSPPNYAISSGTTLSGSGTFGYMTVLGGGILAPSAKYTLYVKKNLIMLPTSTLKVNTFANGTNSKVATSGTATINGGNVNVNADGAGTWNNSTDYTILTATGGVNGKFASVTDNLAFLDPTLSYESGAVKLTLARNDVSYVDVVVPTQAPTMAPTAAPTEAPTMAPTEAPTMAPTVAPTEAPTMAPIPEPTPPPLLTIATRNTLEVARALDNAQVTPNAHMQELYTTLNSMNLEQAREAIVQLGGTPLGSLSHQSNAQTGSFSTSLFSRMAGGGGGGSGLASLAFADNSDMAQTFRYLADAGAIGANGFVEPQKVGDTELWIRAVGGKTLSSGDSARNVSKSTTNTGGVQTGMDKKMDEWIVGGSFGYLKSNMQQTGLDGAINSYQGGAYVSQDTQKYRLSLNAIAGKYATTTSRTTPTGVANADYDGLSLSTEIKAAYKYTLSKSLTLEPTIGGWIQQYAQDNYSESGALGSNLSIDKATFASQALTTELKIINSFGESKEEKKTLEASVGYNRESGDINAPLVGRFSAAPTAGSFSIASANRGEDVLTAMVGGDISVAKYTKLFGLVNANKRENEEGYTAMAGVKIGF